MQQIPRREAGKRDRSRGKTQVNSCKDCKSSPIKGMEARVSRPAAITIRICKKTRTQDAFWYPHLSSRTPPIAGPTAALVQEGTALLRAQFLVLPHSPKGTR